MDTAIRTRANRRYQCRNHSRIPLLTTLRRLPRPRTRFHLSSMLVRVPRLQPMQSCSGLPQRCSLRLSQHRAPFFGACSRPWHYLLTSSRQQMLPLKRSLAHQNIFVSVICITSTGR